MKRIIGLLVFAIAMTGCQKGEKSTRVSTGGDRSGGVQAGQTSTPSGVTLNGRVTTDMNYQEDFNEGVRDLMEATYPRDYVGYVAADGSNNTGVFIGGRVELANGQPLTSGNTTSAISINSELLIAVYDRFADGAQMDGLIPIYLKQASGQISGNSVYLKFYDAYGYVELKGTISSNTFVGDFHYNTLRTYDGQSGYRGTLGRFQVPTCQFFRCQ